MAEIDVQPKHAAPWGFRILILLIVIAAAFYWFKGRSTAPRNPVVADTTNSNSATK